MTQYRSAAALEDDIKRILGHASSRAETDSSAADIAETVTRICHGFSAITRALGSESAEYTFAGLVIAALYIRDAAGVKGESRRAANAVAEYYAQCMANLGSPSGLQIALCDVLGVKPKYKDVWTRR